MNAARLKKAAGTACALVLSAASLAACQTTAPGNAPAWDDASRRQVVDQMTTHAARAANALETLAMIERARTEPPPSPISEALASFPDELRRPTTFEWSGPANQLVERIARSIGYQFLRVGNPPSVEPMVSITARELPTIKAFENIGLQLTPYATVAVDPNAKRVELRYETADKALPRVPGARDRMPK